MHSRSDGQQLALDQLEAMARVSGSTIAIGTIVEPAHDRPSLLVDVSLRVSHIEQTEEGVQLRARERLEVLIPPDFPFQKPSAFATHRRWAGTPHVHWGSLLCLYQAISEWDPSRGMYGFLERLELWMTQAAAGELDPDDAPLHPPMIYNQRGSTLFIPTADAPAVGEEPWIGFATLDLDSPLHTDIVGWDVLPPSRACALAVLLPQPFSWEYPERVGDLLNALEKQGVATALLWRTLALCAGLRDEGEPLHIVLGTPMRRGNDGHPRQHLAVWEISGETANKLRKIAPVASDGKELADARAAYGESLLSWAKLTSLTWCYVAENRPEIVIRRDDRSPIPQAFAGKMVSIWGCGAIGAHVAEWLARAGVTGLVLYDNDIVTPGILVRQPFTAADVGMSKVKALSARLLAIRPDLSIQAKPQNVMNGPLGGESWHDGADIVIDATASALVRLKLELLLTAENVERRTVIGMLFGHTAERSIATVAPAGYTGGLEDVLRQAKIACAQARHLRGFADEFWPTEPRGDHFQPEPGCSDVTFRGAGAEVAALAAQMLHAVSVELTRAPTSASAHLFALPSAEHDGWLAARLSWQPAVPLLDGVGDYQLRVGPEALAEIRGWVARNDRVQGMSSETGGVLYGRRDETCRILWIDRASGPPPDSVASPEEFLCGTAGVGEMTLARAELSRGELRYLGMWHTHPEMAPRPSIKDLVGMLGLVASEPLREAAMLIVGGSSGRERLAGYVFNGDALKREDRVEIVLEPRPRDAPPPPSPEDPDVGLALSGGGSRAVAFHLGCLRALHDRGVLERVCVVSGVSGGALMSAMWAYGPERFEEFEATVIALLRMGLQRRIAKRALLSRRLPQAMASSVVAGGAAVLARAGGHRGAAPLTRRWSRTDAFRDVLAEVLGGRRMDAARVREGLDVVINACDLRTGHAVRFGSRESGSWTLGRIAGNDVHLATAVAASAAYPLLLPALDRTWSFERRDGSTVETRLALTDGGVFDNLGTSPLRPGRSEAHSYNVFEVPYVISCDAGRGQLRAYTPFHAPSRVKRAFEASFRKLQDSGRAALHEHAAHGELTGFVMPYLGQQDASLPWLPADLVRREEVADYPTDFASMPATMVDLLARRGEQLTRLLLDAHSPEL
jgi:predicted acylesterase/phospholipase RssA